MKLSSVAVDPRIMIQQNRKCSSNKEFNRSLSKSFRIQYLKQPECVIFSCRISIDLISCRGYSSRECTLNSKWDQHLSCNIATLTCTLIQLELFHPVLRCCCPPSFHTDLKASLPEHVYFFYISCDFGNTTPLLDSQIEDLLDLFDLSVCILRRHAYIQGFIDYALWQLIFVEA